MCFHVFVLVPKLCLGSGASRVGGFKWIQANRFKIVCLFARIGDLVNPSELTRLLDDYV